MKEILIKPELFISIAATSFALLLLELEIYDPVIDGNNYMQYVFKHGKSISAICGALEIMVEDELGVKVIPDVPSDYAQKKAEMFGTKIGEPIPPELLEKKYNELSAKVRKEIEDEKKAPLN